MALETRAADSRLQLRLDKGTDGDGRRIIRTKTLTRIKHDSADQDLFDVAQAVASLQKNGLVGIIRVDQSELVNV
ncbi:MAG: DUF1659 domain-containing protein [Clostridia bacterium]|nr:DUF1659 domain-containing protein [Clostridia bacterium]